MKTYIKNVMNEHEENNPHEKHLNDLSLKDLKSGDKFYPAKPLILHAAYGLDGGVHRKDLFHSNYDNGLAEDEKDEIDEDILEIAELNAMLHHPEAILDPSLDENISDNRKLAREVLKHLAGKEDEESILKTIREELYRPLTTKLLDTLFDEENILSSILHPTMVKGTEHPKKHYGAIINHMLTQGIADASHQKNWEKALPKLFNHLKGEM